MTSLVVKTVDGRRTRGVRQGNPSEGRTGGGDTGKLKINLNSQNLITLPNLPRLANIVLQAARSPRSPAHIGSSFGGETSWPASHFILLPAII